MRFMINLIHNYYEFFLKQFLYHKMSNFPKVREVCFNVRHIWDLDW